MKACRKLKNKNEKNQEKEAAMKGMKTCRKRKTFEDPEGFKEDLRNQVKRFRGNEKARAVKKV